jgi:hypothetical protein
MITYKDPSGRKQMLSQQVIFHPLFKAATALAAAFLFSIAIIWRFDGEFRSYLLTYFIPIGIPFVLFIFDRVENRRELRPFQWMIDALVLILSLGRAVVLIPLISGHALFLTYAIFTTRSWLARLTAVAVMLEVCYLKAIVWRDPTLIGGIVVGCIAVLIFHRMRQYTGSPFTAVP